MIAPPAAATRPTTVGARGRARSIATVAEDRCSGCGQCVDACPHAAITLQQIAVIDGRICTGCGACLAQCPQEALSLERPAPAPSVAG